MIFCNDLVFNIVDKRFTWVNDHTIPDNTKVWGEWIWTGNINIIKDKVNKLLNTNIPHIFVMINESNHPELVDVIKEYQDEPRLMFFGDFLPTMTDLTNHRPSISWFVEPTNYYSSNSNGWKKNSHQWAIDLRKNLINDYSPNRPKLFDALLGMQKHNRTFVYDAINNNTRLKDLTFLSYFREKDGELEKGTWKALNMPQYHAWPDGDNFWITHSSSKVPGPSLGFRAVSRYSVVPWDLYNQSYYSIVAETSDHSTYSQFTEKVAKPIIGRRPFVVFAGYRYLRNLRRLGFKTFNGIIDESYDEIEVYEDRWQCAVDALTALSFEDPEQIYHKTEKIRIHNYKHFLNTNWHQHVSDELNNILG